MSSCTLCNQVSWSLFLCSTMFLFLLFLFFRAKQHIIHCGDFHHRLKIGDHLSEYVITHFNDFQLACLGSFFLHESVFFLSGLPFIYFERAGWLSKYKIQPKNNSPEAQEKCITRLLLYHFCVNLPVMVVSYPVFRFMGMRSSLPLPSWKVISIQILFYFILEDFVFYWGHRILHTKWLYKHVHSVHHDMFY
ncbi:hypothetical protein CsSME_00041033 [Camellia sinensis var. sinensis]